MFDTNHFKRSVKAWVKEHPQADLPEFLDFCEELIPPQLYASNKWLVDQSVAWYQHVLTNRKNGEIGDDDDEA